MDDLQIVNLLCYCPCIYSSNYKDFESVLVYARKLLGIPSYPIKNTEEVDIQ